MPKSGTKISFIGLPLWGCGGREKAKNPVNGYVFLTNDFNLPATTIAALYKRRWQIELFFKWIKQHLRIKSFYGTSQNAVKAQIWIAVSVYLLVAIAKKRLGIELSLYTILQILSVSILEKTPLVELFSQSDYTNRQPPSPNQLLLFE